jgi:hypothetical protein
MNFFRHILLVFLFLQLGVAAEAQLKIISREKVESVSSPRLSADSAALRFQTRHIVAEVMNEDDPPKTFMFRFENVGDRVLNINRLVSTCSCMTATSERLEVRPGEVSDIMVRYNPKGHPGKFDRKVYVYTDSGNDPAAVLRLSVQVEAGRDLSGEWPVQMGTVRLRRSEIAFTEGVRAVEKMRFVNTGRKPLKLECETAFLPECLSFRTEPQIVEAGNEGEIVITYDPSKGADLQNVKIILKGLGLPPSRSSIIVKRK